MATDWFGEEGVCDDDHYGFNATNYCVGLKVTTPADIDTLISVVPYIRYDTAAVSVKGCVWLVSTRALIDSTDAVATAAVYGWLPLTFTSPVVLTPSTAYWFGLVMSTVGGTAIMKRTTTGTAGLSRINADNNYATPAAMETYSDQVYNWSIKMEYNVTESGWTNIAKVGGIAAVSIAKINGVSVANIAKINGVAV